MIIVLLGELSLEYYNYILMNQRNKKLDQSIEYATRRVVNKQAISLNFFNHDIDEISFRQIFTASKIKQFKIKSLNISQNRIGSMGCHQFKKDNFINLVNLDLSLNNISQEGSKILSQLKWNCLKIFVISSNMLHAEGLFYLSNADWLYGLRQLNLSNNNIQDLGLSHFYSKQFPKLEQLYLINNNITQLGVKSLRKLGFPSLQTLSLGKNKITNYGCKYITEMHLPQLKLLHLNDNSINHEGVNYLCRDGKWQKLTLLHLANNPIGNKACKYIKQANFKQLEWLSLSNCEIGDVGLAWISKTNWSNLQTLRLEQNPNLTVGGFKFFSKSVFPKLQNLQINMENCSNEINKQIMRLRLPSIRKLKIYDSSRYYYYRFRRNGAMVIEDKQFWNDQFAQAFLNVDL